MTLTEKLRACKILPVLTPPDVPSTLKVAEALSARGMKTIEITLRSPAALESIAALSRAFPDMTVAAGTITNRTDLADAINAGAQFTLSPGISRELLDAAADLSIPFIPGVATPSEIMLARTCGIDLCKLFPAVALGGTAYLQALAGPFPDMLFCPTGGINENNIRAFLALPNVVCCGGSWMVAEDLIAQRRWNDIQQITAAALRQACGS